MFFKRNKNQENDCDANQAQESTDINVGQAQEKHKIKTRYFVKLEDGQYIMKTYFLGTVKRGTDEYWHYATCNFDDAKRTQQDFGGVIYEVVEDTCIRPHVGGGIVDQHVNGEAPIKTQEEIPEKAADLIKQLRNGNEHVNAGMATNIKLDTAELAKSINALTEALSAVALSLHEDNADKEHQQKIHEISNQPLGVYGNNKLTSYWWTACDNEIVELLSKPNTRLAIIEDDEDA